MSGGTGMSPGGDEPTGNDESTPTDESTGQHAQSTGQAQSDRRDQTRPRGFVRHHLARIREPLPTPPDPVLRWWRFFTGTLAAHLGIDARALAAFRIALGGVMVLNLVLRVRSLETFYTDHGLYPRVIMADLYPMAEALSIHGQFGSAGPQLVLIAVGVLAALALVVGYRSSLAAIVSLVLLFSLHGRNPLVLNGGDILLRHLLFWAIILPVGERWSVDAVGRSRPARDWIASIATAGLLGQVFVVYATNAVLKSRGESWHDGSATIVVFQLDQFTVLLGDFVAELTPLLRVFGLTWYWLATLSVLLIVLRGWPRAVFASMIVGAHASMFLTMQLGVFPLVSITSLLVFYPTPVWDRVERYLARPLQRYTDRALATLGDIDPIPSAPDPGWWRRTAATWRGVVVPVVAAIAVFAMVVSNVGAVTTADMGPIEATDLSEDNPRWTMFAPNPLREASWYTMAGTTETGERVDAFRGGEVSYDRPPDMADTYPTARWRKYFSYLNPDKHGQADLLQAGLAGYLCHRYNESHEVGLSNVTITRHTELIDISGNNTLDRETLGTFDCRGTPTETVVAARDA